MVSTRGREHPTVQVSWEECGFDGISCSEMMTLFFLWADTTLCSHPVRYSRNTLRETSRWISLPNSASMEIRYVGFDGMQISCAEISDHATRYCG